MRRLLFLLPLVFLFGCGAGTQKATTDQSEVIVKKVLSEERIREIRSWVRKGRLGFDFEQNKAFMDRSLWVSRDFDEKFELAQDLAIYMANKNESDVYEATIVDKISAERMAEYDKLGFRRYDEY